jgi:hypothetical protein
MATPARIAAGILCTIQEDEGTTYVLERSVAERADDAVAALESVHQ